MTVRSTIRDRVGPRLRAVIGVVDLEHRADRQEKLRAAPSERLSAIVRTPAWLSLAGDSLAGDELSASVVMPTRNRAELVRRSVRTVLDQRHQRWELLIGDDGSDDDTPKVVEALADE